MFQQVSVVNRSLRPCQWSQLRSIAQLNVKGPEELHKNVQSQEWVTAKPTSEIPGPSVFNMLRGFMPGGEYYQMSLNDFTLAGRRKYGDIFMVPAMLGKPSMLMSFNPEDFPIMLHSEGIWPLRQGLETMNYHRTVHRKEDYGDVIGLLGSNGEAWGKIRSSVNPILMKSQNTRLYLDKMQEVNSEFLQRIREIRDPNTMEVPDNFLNEINRLTFESVAVIALDQQIGLIRKNRDNEDAQKLFDSLRNIFDLTLDLDLNPSIWRFVSTPKFKQMMKSYDNIHDIIMKLINQALERIEEKEKSSSDEGKEKSVLEKLLNIDKKVAVVMALDLLMAGVDTTSTTLTGNLLCLAKNPDKQMKLRQEICSVLPQKDSLLTVDSMKNLPYLRACLKEGIRMYPIGSGFPRLAGENIVLSGYQVPEKTVVFLNSNLLLLEDEHVPNAKQYLPERWLRSEKSSRDPINPFIFIPFGFGARSCVGKRLVEMELETTIARLVRNFNIEFNYSTENAFRNRMINSPAIPLKFKFSEVQN